MQKEDTPLNPPTPRTLLGVKTTPRHVGGLFYKCDFAVLVYFLLCFFLFHCLHDGAVPLGLRVLLGLGRHLFIGAQVDIESNG